MSTLEINQSIDTIHLDTLREIGNIGAGNAMTSLATMIDHKVDMSIPHVGIIPLTEFANLTGGVEAETVCIYMPVTGEAPGHVAFLLPLNSALRLTDQLMGRVIGETQSLEEIECSALMEVGNILASSYLVAICDLTGLELFSSPPAIAIDMTGAILSTIATAFASLEDHALTIVTHMGEDFAAIEGYFIYIPEAGSLRTMLRALEMEG